MIRQWRTTAVGPSLYNVNKYRLRTSPSIHLSVDLQLYDSVSNLSAHWSSVIYVWWVRPRTTSLRHSQLALSLTRLTSATVTLWMGWVMTDRWRLTPMSRTQVVTIENHSSVCYITLSCTDPCWTYVSLLLTIHVNIVYTCLIRATLNEQDVWKVITIVDAVSCCHVVYRQ